MELIAVFKKVPEGYIAWVEDLPGANAQGAHWRRLAKTFGKLSGWYLKRTASWPKTPCRARRLSKNRCPWQPCEAPELLRHLEACGCQKLRTQKICRDLEYQSLAAISSYFPFHPRE